MEELGHKCGCGQGITGFGMEFYECEAYPRCLGGQTTFYFMKRDHKTQAVRYVKEAASWTPVQRIKMADWLATNLKRLENFKEKVWGGSL